MIFSSIVFLFFFLPLCLGIYYLTRQELRNLILLILSLLFYTWGENELVAVVLVSISINYILGILISRSKSHKRLSRVFLIVAVILNLGMLGIFKYANFFVDNFNVVLEAIQVEPISLEPIHLPIGISFFTFQAIAYVADIYQSRILVSYNPFNLGLYISFFPHLTAGPIIRYGEMSQELIQRVVTREGFAAGVERFVIGMAKKVLIANNMALVADSIFALETQDLSTAHAWVGIVAYSLQIFFDFSGYSDMAIGLGGMFGFRIPENFNYPYMATSISEFWRRWHITLSNWFRDYLFFPLSRSVIKRGKGHHLGSLRTISLLVTMMLIGLWHGANWNFVIWGLMHGTLMAIEQFGYERSLKKLWSPLQHAYTLLFVMVAWVFFRTPTLSEGWQYIERMFWFRPINSEFNLALLMSNELILAMLAGIVFSFPIIQYLYSWLETSLDGKGQILMIRYPFYSVLSFLTIVVLFVLSVAVLASESFNPFIYFRF